MAIRVGRDTLFQDKKGKWFVKFRCGAVEVVVAIERLRRLEATLDARLAGARAAAEAREQEGSDDADRDAGE